MGGRGSGRKKSKSDIRREIQKTKSFKRVIEGTGKPRHQLGKSYRKYVKNLHKHQDKEMDINL